MDIAADKAKLLAIEHPALRRATFMAMLDRELRRRGMDSPLVVGGLAVEIYTAASYTTGDIDIKGDSEAIAAILREYGFVRNGNSFVSEELDLYIDWLGEGPDRRFEDPGHAVTVPLEQGLTLRVLGYEDIILDRLSASKHWNDADSLHWAEQLYVGMRAAGLTPDLEYMRRQAARPEYGLSAELEALLDRIGRIDRTDEK